MYIKPVVLPGDNSKNPMASYVYWFYKERMGITPDASIMRRFCKRDESNPLYSLMYDTGHGLRIYKPSELGELVVFLDEQGVNAYSPNIVAFPELAMSYFNRHHPQFRLRLDRIIAILLGQEETRHERKTNTNARYDAFDGWAQ